MPAAKPRILIDATPMTPRVDGLSVYIANLIKHLPADGVDRHDISVLLNPDVDWPDLNDALAEHRIAVLRRSIAPIGPRRDLDMWRFLRREGADYDLVHITSNNYPFALRNGICTIHDLTFMQWFDGRPGLPGSAQAARLYMAQVIRNALRSACAIVAVSESTKREIVRLFRPSETQIAKIVVIHEGWEHLDGCVEADAAFPFEEDGYLFFLGSHRVHKNLTNLLQAFKLALPHIPPSKRLVISGSSGALSERHRALLNEIDSAGQRVVFTGYVANAQVRRLYSHADAFIFPSLSEGFGLPVLEAFHYGVPLLSSDATSLPEIAGTAALYFDPTDPQAIATAIARFYADAAIGERLRVEGRARLAQFSWRKAAAETVDLYDRCLDRRPFSNKAS